MYSISNQSPAPTSPRRGVGSEGVCVDGAEGWSYVQVAWVKGHKGVKGNEEADKLCREASILGHETEGVVTPAGLRA